MFSIVRFLALLFLISCTRQKSSDTAISKFAFTNPKQLTSASHSEYELDSLSKKIWTDKIVPDPYYSAKSLARFNGVYGFEIVAVETSADDWSKSFLLTLDEKREMVAFIEITDSYGDASQDKNGAETVVGTTTRTDFLNDSIFIRTSINDKIYNYHQPNEITEEDSIVERFVINRQGKFTNLQKDSVRLVKRNP